MKLSSFGEKTWRNITNAGSKGEYQTPDKNKGDIKIKLEDVSKHFGSVKALDDVSCRFVRNKIHAIAGPNGSGKTTLFELILRLRRPTNGVITSPTPDKIGFSFQQPQFYPNLTVQENLSVFSQLAGKVDDGWKEKLVSELRLDREAHRAAKNLSGGFQKKLDIAVALLSNPEVVILDEPLSDVDRLSRSRIIDILISHASNDGTVIISSHNHDQIESAVDNTIKIKDGRIKNNHEQ